MYTTHRGHQDDEVQETESPSQDEDDQDEELQARTGSPGALAENVLFGAHLPIKSAESTFRGLRGGIPTLMRVPEDEIVHASPHLEMASRVPSTPTASSAGQSSAPLPSVSVDDFEKLVSTESLVSMVHVVHAIFAPGLRSFQGVPSTEEPEAPGTR